MAAARCIGQLADRFFSDAWIAVRDLLPKRYNDPEVVYKYRNFDNNGLRILWDREIYFAAPGTLNDPLDCQHTIGEYLQLAIDNSACDWRREQLLLLRDYKVQNRYTGKVISIQDSFNDLVSRSGVYCLSTTATEALMWSHYSAGHKGFCIGFDGAFFTRLRDDLVHHQVAGYGPVKYAKAPTFMKGFFDAASSLRRAVRDKDLPWQGLDEYAFSVLYPLLTTKSSVWMYENEFRCVKAKSGPVDFPPSAIREIVFGRQSQAMDRFAVRSLLSGPEWKHVQFKTANFVPQTFKMFTSAAE